MDVSNNSDNFVYKRIVLSLVFIFVATAISTFWGRFFQLPQIIKLVYAGFIYLSLLVFPYQYIKQAKSDFNKTAYYILLFFLFFIVVSFIRGLASDGAAIKGNKYISLFFNEYTMLIFFPPVFSFLAVNTKLWLYVRKLYFPFLIYSILCLFLLKFHPSALTVILIPLFYRNTSFANKILILLSALAILYVGFILGSRMYLILLIFSVLAYLTYTNTFFRKKVKLIVLITVLTPLFIAILSMSLGVSPFTILSQSKNNNKELLQDTRTFLYVELATDLIENKSIVLGKGPIGSYYSNFMEEAGIRGEDADSKNRILSEVTFLNYVLKGGIVYGLSYLLVLIIAIFNATFNGKNRFVKMLAIILSGVFFNSFIGDMVGCSLLQIVIWLMIGTCLSSKWINSTDSDIVKLIKVR